MRFTLIYEGELRPRQRGVSRGKAALRRQFHPQLRDQIEPFLEGSVGSYLSSTVSNAEFICLVVSELHFRAELDVLLMTGGDRVKAGDLDVLTRQVGQVGVTTRCDVTGREDPPAVEWNC